MFGRIIHPGGVQGTFRGCVDGHALVRTFCDQQTIGLYDLVGLLTNLGDSMTL